MKFDGIVYRSIGWALPDVLAVHPLWTDQQVAVALDVSPSAVQQARVRAGIPEYAVRSSLNPYMLAGDDEPVRRRAAEPAAVVAARWADVDRLAGRAQDRVVAERTGRSEWSVTSRRRALGIPAYRKHTHSLGRMVAGKGTT